MDSMSSPVSTGQSHVARKVLIGAIVAVFAVLGFLLWSGKLGIDIGRFFAAESVPAGAISVKDFGALGDGVTDDAPAIQAAIDSLSVAGGTIYFPAGTYMLGTSAGSQGRQFHSGTATGPVQSALLVNKSNVTFTGESEASVLKLMASRKMNIIAANAANIIIEKLTFDGNKANRDGSVPWPDGDVVDALIYGSPLATNFEIRFCEIRNGIEDGIGVWNTKGTYVHDCFIHDNGTLQAGGAGVAISGPGNTGARVISNTLSNNTATNLWLAWGSSDTLVQGNIIEKGPRNGISTGGTSLETTGLSTGHTILENTIRGNFVGIAMVSSQDGIIKNNTILDNEALAIQISDQGSIPSKNILIEGNICSSTELGIQGIGIRILGLSESITLRENECRDNGASIARQIIVTNESAVNSDWREVNTISYNEPSETETPTPEASVPGDVDGDGDVDIFDYNLVVSNFGGSGLGDADGDGDVDIFDYNLVVSNFGQ